MRFCLSIFLFLIAGFLIGAAHPGENPFRSDGEGPLDPKHHQGLQEVRQRFIYNRDGSLSKTKINQMIEFLRAKSKSLEESVRMSEKIKLIQDARMSQDEAEQDSNDYVTKDRGPLFAFDIAIAQAQDLLKAIETQAIQTQPLQTNVAIEVKPLGQLSPPLPNPQLTEKIETLLTFVVECETLNPDNLWSETFRTIRNLSNWFVDVKVDDTQALQASNLYHNGHFLSQTEIVELRQNGKDISKLNPPSSMFWTNNKIESYDPKDETLLGEQLFPTRDIEVPEFWYKNIGGGNIKLKTYFYDKKGKKKSVTLKLGREINAETMAVRLAESVGYPIIRYTHRKKIKLHLENIDYTTLLRDVASKNPPSDFGSLATYAERIPGENAIYLKNVEMEAYPSKKIYRKMGYFRSGHNGMGNRREIRALPVLQGFLNLYDTRDTQTRVDAWRNSEGDSWKTNYIFADYGWSMGAFFYLPAMGSVNHYPKWYTTKNETTFRLWWFNQGFDPEIYEQATFSDFKWLARRLARLSEKQIIDIVNESGFPTPVQELYLEKIKGRINNLITNTGLESEGVRLLKTRSDEDLHNLYPKYISKSGFLTYEAESLPDTNMHLHGPCLGILEGVMKLGIEAFTNKLYEFASVPGTLKSDIGTTFDLGQAEVKGEMSGNISLGLTFGGKRNVSINPEAGPGQGRFLVKDTYTIMIPVGFNNTFLETPLNTYYLYSFEYTHSYDDPTKMVTSKFFNNINPASLVSIKKDLSVGQTLKITQSWGANVGYLRISPLKQATLNLSLLAAGTSEIRSLYVVKPFSDQIEVLQKASSSNTLSSGFDIALLLKLGAGIGRDTGKETTQLFRFDLLNANQEEAEMIKAEFQNLLNKGDFTSSSKFHHKYNIDGETIRNYSQFKFAIWDWASASQTNISEITLNEKPFISSDQAFLQNPWTKQNFLSLIENYKKSSGRSILGDSDLPDQNQNQNVLASKILPASGKMDPFTENSTYEATVTATASKDHTDFDEIKIKLNFAYADNWCTRQEFEDEVKPFFNTKIDSNWSGRIKEYQDLNYINTNMPNEITAFSPFAAEMRWEISKQGFEELIAQLKKPSVMWELNKKHRDEQSNNQNTKASSEVIIDLDFQISQHLVIWEAPVPPSLSDKAKRAKLAGKLKAAMSILRLIGGDTGYRVGWLRNWISDPNLWIVTSLANVTDYTTPTLISGRTDYWYAREIGAYPGPTMLEKVSSQRRFLLSF